LSAAAHKRRLIAGLSVACTIVIAVALAWRFTPLAESIRPESVAQRLEAIEELSWAPVAFVGAYLLGGLVMFPVTVLSAATAIVFPPIKAVPVSFAGIMLSAALLHWLGARFLRRSANKTLGSTIRRVDRAMTDRGVMTVAAIRMLPLAPFTLVNLAAGSLGVRFRDFMLGTALGLTPGIVVVCFFGRQVRAFWRQPSMTAVLMLIGIGIVWIAMSLALQRWVASRTSRRRAA
jgi:phospholipase D1/2